MTATGPGDPLDGPPPGEPTAPAAACHAPGTQDERKATAYCTYCPKLCRHSCPVADVEKRETVIPQAKMQLLHHVRQREIALTTEVADVFYRCTGCNRQKTYCKHGTELEEPMFQARALAVQHGVEPASLAGFDERFLQRRRELAAVLPATLPAEDLCVRPAGSGVTAGHADGAEVLVFPGCAQLSDNPGGLRPLLTLLRRLGLGKVAVLAGADPCNGFPFLTTGRPAAFQSQAEMQAPRLAEARLIVANCPSCVHTLRVVYPSRGIHLRAPVVHTTELFARHQDRLGLQRGRASIAYHDPCYLGRHLGVYEPPRQLVRAVGELREMAHHHADALCSGGGGALPLTAPATATGIAHRCLQVGLDGLDHGGQRPPDVVATACPQARRMLRRATPEGGPPVRDLVELLHDHSDGNDTR
jgi:Fe-S oxidoreductase